VDSVRSAFGQEFFFFFFFHRICNFGSGIVKYIHSLRVLEYVWVFKFLFFFFILRSMFGCLIILNYI